MFRFYLKASLLLFVLCSVLVIVTFVTHYRDNPVEELGAVQESCTTVCLFAIEPGKTSVQQAKTLLQNHDWIVNIREAAPGTGYAHLSWNWSGTQPAVIDASREGKLTFVWDDDDPLGVSIGDSIVETVTIYTRAGIYMFEEWYGHPSAGAISTQLEGILGYAVYYNKPGGHINLRIDVVCPANLAAYWAATARMTISIGQASGPYTRPIDMLKLC